MRHFIILQSDTHSFTHSHTYTPIRINSVINPVGTHIPTCAKIKPNTYTHDPKAKYVDDMHFVCEFFFACGLYFMTAFLHLYPHTIENDTNFFL